MLWSTKLPKDHSIVISEIFTMAVTFELSTIMRLHETIREMPQIPPTLLWRLREEIDAVEVMCVPRMEPDVWGLLQGWLSMAPATEVVQRRGTVPQDDVMAVWWIQRQGLQWEPSDDEYSDDQEGESDRDEEGYESDVSAVAQPGTLPPPYEDLWYVATSTDKIGQYWKAK